MLASLAIHWAAGWLCGAVHTRVRNLEVAANCFDLGRFESIPIVVTGLTNRPGTLRVEELRVCEVAWLSLVRQPTALLVCMATRRQPEEADVRSAERAKG